MIHRLRSLRHPTRNPRGSRSTNGKKGLGHDLLAPDPLIAAAGGVVLPLMAGEALALPSAQSTSSINTQAVTSTIDPRESTPRTGGEAGSASSVSRMEVDK